MKSKIIVMTEDKDKLLNMSLYDFINEQYRKANPVMVYHVTEEEFEIMKIELATSGELVERYARAKKEDIPYNKYRYLLAYNKKENNLHVADYNNPDKVGCYVIDGKGIRYNEKEVQFPNDPAGAYSMLPKVYTTENYANLIDYYEEQQNKVKIELSKEDVKKYENAYESLTKSVNSYDYNTEDLQEFRRLFAKVVEKSNM